MKAYAIPIALLLWAASLVWCGYSEYTHGYTAGSNAAKVAQAEAAQAVKAEGDRQQTVAAAAGQGMRAQLDITLPQIEVHTDATRDQIHTLYLGLQPAAAAECRRPDGVQAALDAAIDRANAAARGDLRPGATAEAATEGAGPP